MSCSEGLLTEKRCDFFRTTIDTWFKSYVSGWKPTGEAIETEPAKKARGEVVGQRKKKRKATKLEPHSPYKKGKWEGTVPNDNNDGGL